MVVLETVDVTGADLQCRVVCRFLAGFGGSVGVSIGGGTISDIWHRHERGRAVAIYSLMPLLGPAVGMSTHLPICYSCHHM